MRNPRRKPREPKKPRDDLLPTKSGESYKKAYDAFVKQMKLGRRKPTETDVLRYVQHLSEVKKQKVKTLWTKSSMVKAVAKIFEPD